jgi:hypothetical protein
LNEPTGSSHFLRTHRVRRLLRIAAPRTLRLCPPWLHGDFLRKSRQTGQRDRCRSEVGSYRAADAEPLFCLSWSDDWLPERISLIREDLKSSIENLPAKRQVFRKSTAPPCRCDSPIEKHSGPGSRPGSRLVLRLWPRWARNISPCRDKPAPIGSLASASSRDWGTRKRQVRRLIRYPCHERQFHQTD